MKRTLLILLAVTLLFTFTSCNNKYFQVNPSTDVEQYERLGRDIGSYMKVKKPGNVEKAAPWVAGALVMTDEQLISNNVLQTAYEYALKSNPEDAEFILLIKSAINMFGIKIDTSNLLPEERSVWVECTRAILKGYSEATK